MNKEMVMLIVNLLSNNSVVLDYLIEGGDGWSSKGYVGFDKEWIWCDEFMSGKYEWIDEGVDEVKIEFYYNEEEILCFKLWVGNLFVDGIF
jgi:hypothetical protein